MINLNPNHKKVDIGLLDIIKKRILPICVSGLIIGSSQLFEIKNAKAEDNSTKITIDSTTAEFEYLEDLSILENYPNIEKLTISNTKISDSSILNKLINLKSLELNNCKITDEKIINNPYIKDLELRNVTANLNLNLINLENIYAYNSNSGQLEINFGNDFNNLKNVKLENIKLNNYNLIYSCTNELSLVKMNLYDLNLENLSNKLSNIIINNSKINEIKLNKNNNIKEFQVLGNDYKDYSFITYLKQAELINLGYTNISDTIYFKDLNNLKSLSLSGTKIKNIDNLPVNLERLTIEHLDRIENINRIYDLKKLKYLNTTGIEYIVDDNLYNYIINNNIEHSITSNERNSIKEFQKIVDKIITPDMDDFEKVEAIKNYIVKNIDFNIKKTKDPNVLTSVLEGEGVCQGYSDMAVILGRLAGVEIYSRYS